MVTQAILRTIHTNYSEHCSYALIRLHPHVLYQKLIHYFNRHQAYMMLNTVNTIYPATIDVHLSCNIIKFVIKCLCYYNNVATLLCLIQHS